MAGCSLPIKTVVRAFPPISMTTRSCSTVCSNCCKHAGAAPTCNSPSSWPIRLLKHFEDREPAVSFSPPTIMNSSCIARDPSATKPCRPAMPSRRKHSRRLGLLLGETRYLDAAAKTLRAAWPALQHYPHAHTALLVALEEHLTPPEIVIVRGDDQEVARVARRTGQGLFATTAGVRSAGECSRIAGGDRGQETIGGDGGVCLPRHDLFGAGAIVVGAGGADARLS